MQKLFSAKEAADKIGVSVWTLRRWVRERDVKCGRLFGGTRLRFSEKQVEQAIQAIAKVR